MMVLNDMYHHLYAISPFSVLTDDKSPVHTSCDIGFGTILSLDRALNEHTLSSRLSLVHIHLIQLTDSPTSFNVVI